MARRQPAPACIHVATGERPHRSLGLCAPCYGARRYTARPGVCRDCSRPHPTHTGRCRRCYDAWRRVAADGLPADFDSRLLRALVGGACPVQYCACGRRIGGGSCPVCAPDLTWLFDGEDIAAARWARLAEYV